MLSCHIWVATQANSYNPGNITRVAFFNDSSILMVEHTTLASVLCGLQKCVSSSEGELVLYQIHCFPLMDATLSCTFVIRSLGELSNLYMIIDLLYMSGQSLLMDLMYTPFPYRCVEMFFRQGLRIFVTRSWDTSRTYLIMTQSLVSQGWWWTWKLTAMGESGSCGVTPFVSRLASTEIPQAQLRNRSTWIRW